MRHTDEEFCAHVADRLAGLPGVQAVSLGGSRASGTHRPGSDWDFAVYYRGGFDPADLRALGWPGEVFEIGGWGGGVFNGGAWLQVDGRRVDVHYRDLDDVEHHIAEAERGRFRVEWLMFYLAGVPTYVVVGELALNRVLHGALPRPDYPDALRRSAFERWWSAARLTIAYARSTYAAAGRVAGCAGGVARAACETAHAVMAARGHWVLNEKSLLDRAGLRGVDQALVDLTGDPSGLIAAVDAAAARCEAAVGAIVAP